MEEGPRNFQHRIISNPSPITQMTSQGLLALPTIGALFSYLI